MNELYKQISRDTRKSKQMRNLALDLGSKGIKLREQQDILYKQLEFKKKFLEARSKINGLDE